MRADPNAPVPEGRVSPLQYVIGFAPEQHVVAMRDLLLQYGAIETEEDKERWQLRQYTDAHDYRYTRAFFEDDRHLSPVGAAMEMQ